jgi:CRISPR-associated protein Csd1
MILQSLYDYYQRKAADPESGIAPEGWEWKEIPFIAVLDAEGNLLRIDPTSEGEGKNKRAKRFLVPQGVKKASGIAANLLWDAAGYVLGIINTDGLDSGKAEKATERAPKQKQAFTKRIEDELPKTVRRDAVLRFLSETSWEALESTPECENIRKTNSLISFRFEGELELFCRSKEVRAALAKTNGDRQADGICLVSGESDHICELHTAVKNVYGAQTAGANIVSFNLDSFRSFRKKQGANAPVGEKAVFAYTTALNALLSRDSAQRIQVGEASTVFWSERKTSFESDFAFFFKEPDKDDPAAGVRRIRSLFESPGTGGYIEDSGGEKFFVLGLSPNAARISVRFWQVGTVAEFASRIRQHFEDLSIAKPPKEPEFYSLWRLLVNIATQDKSENIPPNLAGEFMRSILEGAPYPQTLLQSTLRRIRSDTENRVKPVRAALLKAYLNRSHRVHPSAEKEILVALDPTNTNSGYLLGRLFAVLEKIQEDAQPGINATIRDRFYGAASSSPVTVFPQLLKLKNHHLAKLENPSFRVSHERRLTEIVGNLPVDMPSHLPIEDQARFAIGYYHQRQSLFTKSDKTEHPAKEA